MFSRRQAVMFIAAPVVLTLGPVGAAFAVESAESPDALIRSLGGEAIQMLADSSLSQQQRETEFRQLLHKGFDVDLIGRLALGRFWRDATDAQKAEYQRLFEAYIVKSYLARLGHYAGETLQVQNA